MNGAAALPPRMISTPSPSSNRTSGTSQYFLFCLSMAKNSPARLPPFCSPACSKLVFLSSLIMVKPARQRDISTPLKLPVITAGINHFFRVGPVGFPRLVGPFQEVQPAGRAQQQADRREHAEIENAHDQ